MKSTDKSLSCEDVLERVEAFVDGDLPHDEVPLVEVHLHACRLCADEVTFAREMQVSLRSFHKMECPDRVVEAVYRHIGLESEPVRMPVADRPSLWEKIRMWFSSPRLAPALGFAVIVVIAGFWLLKPGSTADPSKAEIAAAQRQVEWTLAYLGSVNEKVTAVATESAVQPYIVEPVQRAVETALQTNATLE